MREIWRSCIRILMMAWFTMQQRSHFDSFWNQVPVLINLFKATVAALGLLCKDNRIYPARPVLDSGDCKHESGREHAEVLKIVLKGIDTLKEKTKIRVTSIASDGETRRGSAFIELTFKHKLSQESPIYALLRPLCFLNLFVGDDDLTCDKDYKHVFKRFWNLFV